MSGSFCKKSKLYFQYKKELIKLVSTRRSTVPSLPLQSDFHGIIHQNIFIVIYTLLAKLEYLVNT